MHRILALGAAALLAAILCGGAAAWSWPADGAVLQPFTLGADAYAGGQHRGIDVEGSDGSQVRAPASGVVTFAGSLPTYGRGVTILTSDGYAVTLVHLGAIGVSKGATVSEGAAIGTMGSSGTPEHSLPSVHLGIRRASDEQGYVDPLGLLPPRGVVSDPSPGPAASPEPALPPATVESPVPPSPAPVPTPAPLSTAAVPAGSTASPAGSPATGAPPATATPVSAAASGVDPAVSGSDAVSTGGASAAPAREAPAPRGGPTPTGASTEDAAAPVFEVTAGSAAPPVVAHHPTGARGSGPARGRPAGHVSAPPSVETPPARNASAAPASHPALPRAAHAHAATSGRGTRVARADVSAPRAAPSSADAATSSAHAATSSAHAPSVSHVHVPSGGAERRTPPVPASATQQALGGGTAVQASGGPHPAAPPRAEGPATVAPETSHPADLRRIGLAVAIGVLLAAMVVRRVARRLGGHARALLPHVDDRRVSA
jgi:Peptidase family M23